MNASLEIRPTVVINHSAVKCNVTMVGLLLWEDVANAQPISSGVQNVKCCGCYTTFLQNKVNHRCVSKHLKFLVINLKKGLCCMHAFSFVTTQI